MTDFHGIELRLDAHVAELVLNLPDTLNAFDEPLHRGFIAALEHVRDKPDVRCLTLSARGPVFSVGGSYDFIEGLVDNVQLRASVLELGTRLFSTLTELPVPVVAAMHGDAIGLGATIVTSCDVVVAHPGARLIDPHVRVGLCAGDGGVPNWALAAGLMRAKRYLLTGDPIDGRQAHAIGLVTDLVDDATSVGPTARDLAKRIAQLPPRTVRGTKFAFNALARELGRTAFAISIAQEARCFELEDTREAIRAARDKRVGRYAGA